jgi:eukaryotic-like serine/threonine-protein kinase
VPPRRPLIWPWLLLLLLLVAGGLGLAYVLSRDGDDDDTAENRVPLVVGLRAADAVERLRASGYPADPRRRVEPAARGRVVEQEPDAGTELEPGGTVVIIVARGRNTVDVPNVVGLPVAEAFERVQAAGLRARSVEAFARQARGRVFRQRPAAGEEAPRQSLVVLTVSRGPQLVTVPTVVGLTEAEAGAALTRAGLRPTAVRVPARDPRGTVVDQNPAPGARAPRGSTVRINVSQGAPAQGSTQATVPDVVDETEADARRLLRDAGFTVIRVVDRPITDPARAGVVVAQAPPAGSSVRRTTEIRIDVGRLG